MDPFVALRRSLLIQLVGLAACDAVSACPDVADVAALPRDGSDGTALACTDRFATAEACLAECDDDCREELADQLAWYDSGNGGVTASVECGPVWVDGECCVVANLSSFDIGRPLRVDDVARTARPIDRDGWSEPSTSALPPDAVRAALVDAWTARALAEHASVASFARVQLELLGLGAPADLVADATRAMSDEVAHARACFGVASAWAGRPIGPGPLDLSGVRPATDAAAVLVDTLLEGCVGETIGAAEAAVSAEACADPTLATLLRRIADEEGRHAALAWRTVRWLVATRPALADLVAPTLARAFDEALARGGDDAEGLAAFGVLDAEARRRVIERVRDEVVGPVAAALAA